MPENHNPQDRPDNLSVAEAKQRLEEGNQRYCADRLNHPRRDAERREAIADGQAPFATVLTCSDSRVPPELIFDKGLGDLFVVRVAGNIVGNAVLGSIEFASLHLGVNLTVVMGHASCGAVKATVANVDVTGPATHSHVDTLIEAIRPAVRNARASGDDDLAERSSQENARITAEQIRRSEPVMAGLCRHGVEILAAYYDLESGEVRWLE